VNKIFNKKCQKHEFRNKKGELIMKLSELLIIALLACSLTIIGCSDDEESPTESSGSDPNIFCDENLCATNDVRKQECIDVFNTCMANNVDANDDECVAAALLTCKE
jgi:hypothetical protein